MTATTVPYIFANDTGNIPLSHLDANFANVKAYANTAGYVTESTQANITSVGTLENLTVTGNIITGNSGYIISNHFSGDGSNVVAFENGTSEIDISPSTVAIIAENFGAADFTSTQTSIYNDLEIAGYSGAHANVSVTGFVSASGNVTSGNIGTTGQVSAAGNITGANFITTGISSRYMDVSIPVYANITASGTYSLSTTHSINILIANNTGYTATLNMPATPVDGQVCNFAVHGNTVTLAVGTGLVAPSFTGSATVGTGYRYVYRNSNSTWYKIG
jgi:hypothetical protein